MKLSELIIQLQKIQSEIGSHPRLDDCVTVFLEDDFGFTEVQIDKIEPDRAMGCGCWIGAQIILKH